MCHGHLLGVNLNVSNEFLCVCLQVLMAQLNSLTRKKKLSELALRKGRMQNGLTALQRLGVLSIKP